MPASARLGRAWPYLTAALFTAVFITPYCGLLFRCGCLQLWAGAARYCNIHHAMGAHCPFCSHGNLGFYGIAGSAIVALQWLLMAGVARRRPGTIWLLATALVGFFVAGALVAFAFALHDHYPALLVSK